MNSCRAGRGRNSPIGSSSVASAGRWSKAVTQQKPGNHAVLRCVYMRRPTAAGFVQPAAFMHPAELVICTQVPVWRQRGAASGSWPCGFAKNSSQHDEPASGRRIWATRRRPAICLQLSSSCGRTGIAKRGSEKYPFPKACGVFTVPKEPCQLDNLARRTACLNDCQPPRGD